MSVLKLLRDRARSVWSVAMSVDDVRLGNIELIQSVVLGKIWTFIYVFIYYVSVYTANV